MGRLLIVLLLLVASVWLALMFMHHPGYLLLVFQPWMVQMPIWFAALGLLIIFVLFYFLIDCMDRIRFLIFKFKNWLSRRHEHKLLSKTQQGLAALIEGQWKTAERLLLAGTSQTLEPLINYLAAAKAAHAQAAFSRSDEYLKKAYEVAPKAELAIGLVQAELDLESDQLEHAAAILNHLRKLAPYHARVLKLLEKVYVRLADWKSLQSLLPAMRKAKVLTREQAEQFEKNLSCEILHMANTSELAELKKIFNDMPRAMRKQPEVVYAYVQQLLRFADSNEVEELIRQTLKRSFEPNLVKIYGDLPFSNLNRQLVIVGGWLKMYGERQEILLVLGKLCVQVKLWGKAKNYFSRCLALGPSKEASLEYGKLLESLGETEEALTQYREGLAI